MAKHELPTPSHFARSLGDVRPLNMLKQEKKLLTFMISN